MAKTREVRFKLNPEDFEQIKKKAEKAGMTLSNFMVFLSKGVRVVVEPVE